ncbi:MAG TPA: hemolysin family protein [Chthoniobacterales bacterium]|jgi:putative hemolysin
MTVILIEILLIFVLLVFNGVFAMTEIALVSAKRGRLQVAADGGDAGAAKALTLMEAPNRFLSTVQIGITLVGILAGAFGGANIADRLAGSLAPIPLIGGAADQIAFSIVIVLLTYFSLVIGELVPKRLAMQRPEGISATMSRPMAALAAAASPVVNFLSWSTDALLGLFGVKPEKEKGVTRDEVTVLIREGMVSGSIGRAESEMVAGVFDLNDLEVAGIMTPRTRILWLRQDAAHAEVWHKIVASGCSHFPIFEETRDRVAGVVSVKALYAQLAGGVDVHFADVMTQPLFVPERQRAIRLLESFQKTGVHVAFAVDEFGSVAGMVTLLDVLEAIVGDLPARDGQKAAEIKQRADGSWLLDAIVDIETLTEKLTSFPLPDGAGENFQTLGGFLTDRLGRVPREGDIFSHDGWELEVLDMDGHRVDKVLATETPAPAAPGN